MTTSAYADGRSYVLPPGWSPVDDDTIATALRQARRALGIASWKSSAGTHHEVGSGNDSSNDRTDAEARLARYFDPAGNFAGSLFNSLPDPTPNEIGPIDLFAVTTLSMRLNALVVRQVLYDPEKRSRVSKLLTGLENSPPLHELGSAGSDSAALLETLEQLYYELRGTPTKAARKWVFASKLIARKRPDLMPVRDNVVCKFLAGSNRLRDGHIGSVRIDLQVFAYLMSERSIRLALDEHWEFLSRKFPIEMSEVRPLRLLDVALWTAGQAQGFVEQE